MTNTQNTPVEALERSFAMRVRRYRLRVGSGGEGAAAGGEGVERELEMLEPVTVSLITERRSSRPWGLQGGGRGAPGENWLLPGGSEAAAERLPDKCTIRLKAGDVLRMLTPGGGGWGSPPAPATSEAAAASAVRELNEVVPQAAEPALFGDLHDLDVRAESVVADLEAGRADR